MKEISLTQGYIALIDDEDYEIVAQYKWYPRKHGKTCYAITNIKNDFGKYKTVNLHHLIFGKKDGQIIDHINGDGLDNRKENLRFCSQSENCNNRHNTWGKSKYKGVHWHPINNKWVARIQVKKKRLHLGCYVSEKEAALAYNKAAIKYFGEFARLNEVE